MGKVKLSGCFLLVRDGFRTRIPALDRGYPEFPAYSRLRSKPWTE
jgi:hypothetical protein